MKPFVFAAVPLMCLVAVHALTGPARAQSAAPGPPFPVESFESQFRRLFDGQPVAAVWSASGHGDEGAPVQPGTKLLYTLQAFGEALSTPEDHLIPFAVRNLWVLAPETRTDLNMDFRGFSPLDAMDPTEAARQFLVSLTREDVRAAGMTGGVPAARLSQKARQYLTAMLSRPMMLQTVEDKPPVPLPGGFDPRAAHIRLVLRAASPTMRVEETTSTGMPFIGSDPLTYHRRTLPRLAVQAAERSTPLKLENVPRVVPVKNAFKPSDLDGVRFRQPFGAKGRVSVLDAIRRLREKTGLELIASRQFHEHSLFVGRADVTCGDVMDALRLGLTAAWRKVGPAYVLAWDRRPTTHLLDEADTAFQSLSEAVKESRSDAYQSANWLMLAEEVPFAPDDPFRWSAQQRAYLFGPPPPSPYPVPMPREPVRFADFTPQQKAAAREIMSKRTIEYVDPSAGGPVTRPMTEEDLEQSRIIGSASIEVGILVPGSGWAEIPGVPPGELESSRLDHIRIMEQARSRALLQADAGNPGRQWVLEPRRFTPDADVRGVMLGALPPARLKALAPVLKKSGINTVFYPALTNGFATFPSKAFPLHPSLGGADGLAAAVREMSAQGIPVIACVEALTWRRNDHPDHWMAKHPDWLDVDGYGRTPLQWVKAVVPESDRERAADLVRGNVVRITEPEVTRRLNLLAEELAKVPGLTGACLVDWRPFAGGIRSGTTTDPGTPGWGRTLEAGGAVRLYHRDFRLPRLGFSLTDRLASLRRSGVDPLDLDTTGARMPPIRLASPPQLREPGMSFVYRPNAPDQRYVHYANGLLESLRKANAALPTWAVVEPDTDRDDLAPRAQTRLSYVAQASSNRDPSILLRLPDVVQPVWENDPFSSLPPIVRTATPRYGRQRRQAIVYDFRDRPDELVGSLEYLVPPGTVPAGQQPWVSRMPDAPDPGGEPAVPATTAPERTEP